MTIRQSLRGLKHLAADLIPWQLVAAVRGRDYNTAVLAAADALADAEAEYETLEPPAGVEPHPPVVPPAGLSDWSIHQLMQHARRWCDLPTIQPGPLATPTGHPDHTP